MEQLFSSKEFDKAGSREKLPCRCLHCHKEFLVPKYIIQGRLKSNRANFIQFCSRKCWKLQTATAVDATCGQCGLTVKKPLRDFSRSKSGNVFCSQSCAAKWNNAHKTKGTRVSKLERWLATRLPELYPGIEFHFNRTDAINGELDIFIPPLKLAFELNGIFHYEPIYGPEKLASIRSNDERKFQACLERGIELCIVDVSVFKNFKLQKAEGFLAIIKTVIDRKTGALWQT